MEISRVGVIGAGQMGNGIAHSLRSRASRWCCTMSRRGARGGARHHPGNIDRRVARGKITDADRAAALARIKLEPELAALGACDLIIEAATEKEA